MAKAHFGTAEWYELLQAATQELLSRSPRPPAHYTFAEIWTGAPPEMRLSPDHEAGFLMTMRGAKVELTRNVKLKQRGDFVVTLPWSRARTAVVVDTGPQWRALFEQLNASGEVTIEGDRSTFPLDIPDFHHAAWEITVI